MVSRRVTYARQNKSGAGDWSKTNTGAPQPMKTDVTRKFASEPTFNIGIAAWDLSTHLFNVHKLTPICSLFGTISTKCADVYDSK